MMIPEYAQAPVVVEKRDGSDTALRAGAWSWGIVMLTGQWLYLYYLVVHYGVSRLSGDLEPWKKNLLKGYVPGDTLGNLSFAAHLLLASTIFLGGLLQLVPQIRARAITFHRWNGRVFVVAGLAGAVDGLYMTWVRGAALNTINAVAVSIDAVLILVFVSVAWRAALTHDIDRHRRWALRAFMVVNAVFFVRIFTFGWLRLTGGAGMADDGNGVMNHAFELASYLVPLAVLELYLRARASTRPLLRFATALVLLLGAAYMAVGTVAYTTHKFRSLT
jgi:uncharacterized membrane protein